MWNRSQILSNPFSNTIYRSTRSQSPSSLWILHSKTIILRTSMFVSKMTIAYPHFTPQYTRNNSLIPVVWNLFSWLSIGQSSYDSCNGTLRIRNVSSKCLRRASSAKRLPYHTMSIEQLNVRGLAGYAQRGSVDHQPAGFDQTDCSLPCAEIFYDRRRSPKSTSAEPRNFWYSRHFGLCWRAVESVRRSLVACRCSHFIPLW